MAQAILREQDFKSGSFVQNIKGIFYRNEGSPIGMVSSPNMGALYLDNLSGQLWVCVTASSTASTSWKPFNAQISSSIRIDTDVQEGDLIGIFGAGTWAISGSTTYTHEGNSCAGSVNATLLAGGRATATVSYAELFNGSTWSTSGTLAVTRYYLAGAGAQNAGLVAGGAVADVGISSTELFNGSSWSSSGNLAGATRWHLPGLGTQTAAAACGGLLGGTVTGSQELFNGATWSAGPSLLVAKRGMAAAGAQNASFIAGGFTSVRVSSTDLFNGSAWSTSAILSSNRLSPASAGTQNSGFIIGGNNDASAATTTCQLFNGSVWLTSGSSSATRSTTGASGSQSSGLVSNGSDGAMARSTELHTQSIYRKLKFSTIQSAQNIGMAYNTTTTSLTASIIRGDLPSNYLPYRTHFGISRFNNDFTSVFTQSITPTVNSIAVSVANQATFNLSTTLTNSFWNGAILLTSAGFAYPIIGGTSIAPIVRWENCSNSASPGITVSPVSGHRISNLQAPAITLSAGSLSLSLTSNMSLTAGSFARWVKVGDTLLIPYSATSGTSGSLINYGTYMINSVSGFTVSVTAQNTLSATESLTIGGIQILQHAVNNKTCLDIADVKLGYNGKMHNPYFAFMDDSSNGRM